jgi:hypothetical protein
MNSNYRMQLILTRIHFLHTDSLRQKIILRRLTWSRLLDPEKKGQWWLAEDVSSTKGNIEDVATVISKDSTETQNLLQLAVDFEKL